MTYDVVYLVVGEHLIPVHFLHFRFGVQTHCFLPILFFPILISISCITYSLSIAAHTRSFSAWPQRSPCTGTRTGDSNLFKETWERGCIPIVRWEWNRENEALISCLRDVVYVGRLSGDLCAVAFAWRM
ncbi:hypothetical protein CEXT_649221 [Caerostris extrusa]|uniref:Uncharacterized protein n=1 Tax=Caerostris extrusa TaxID=172846 RepID=A0AAV4NUD6_CAEEX|nr:hypothetical protein CEXT_649221 [Caerostris extrusa]